jgi:hypothetical protein
MNLRICTAKELINRIKGKTLVAFGAGNWTNVVSHESVDMRDLFAHTDYFVDNNPKLHDSEKYLCNQTFKIKSKQFLLENASCDTAILITCNIVAAIDIYNDLCKESRLFDCDVYFGSMVLNESNVAYAQSIPGAPDGFRMNESPVIPKKIHYCWVGGKPIPDKNRRFMESWSKYNPDYEIIEWNENNYDFTKQPYMKAALDAKCWGFVPDYARLDILYNHGGIYLDVDVEILKPLDELLYNNAFAGYHSNYIAFGLGFGSVSQFPIIGKLRDAYDDLMFIPNSDTAKIQAAPALQTKHLENLGMNINGAFQIFQGMTFYPSVYFDPQNPVSDMINITGKTYTIHHYDGSWTSEAYKKAMLKSYELYNTALKNEKNRN